MDTIKKIVTPNNKKFLSRIKNFYKKGRNRATERRYFLITSSGQMGTFWLASQLNKHPQIFCSHSYDKPAWGACGMPLQGPDGERQRAIIKKYKDNLSLKEFFFESEQVTDKAFIGNVHAFNVDKALPMLLKENLQSVKIVNLVRHPVSRINSLAKCLKNEWFNDGYFDHLLFVPKIYKEHGRQFVKGCFGESALTAFDDSFDKQFFVVSLILERGTSYQAQFAEQNNIPNIRYEDITSSKETMEKLINHIGDDRLISDYNWFNQNISYKRINSHTNTAYDNARSIFDSWDEWKKTLYQFLIKEEVFESCIQKYYEQIHYS